MNDLFTILRDKMDEIMKRGGTFTDEEITEIQTYAFMHTGQHLEFGDVKIIANSYQKYRESKTGRAQAAAQLALFEYRRLNHG